MPAKKEISLLPDLENANSLVNKTIKWLTSIGRVIIIITELVVVTAFLSRFWLDRKNSDLSEVIRQQKAILESTQEFEKQYNLLQQHLKIIEDFNNKNQAIDAKVISLASSIPSTINLDNVSIDATTTDVTAAVTTVAYQEAAIVDFITNLSLNPDIKTVDVKRIEKKPKDNKYFVDIVLVFKNPTSKS